MKKSLFQNARIALIGLVLLGFSHCKVGGPHADIYPSNGSMNVPVNTVIEIQFLPELGLTEAEMKSSSFAMNECNSNTFKYFEAPKTQTTDDAKKDDSKTEEESKEKKDGTAEPTIGKEVHFYHRAVTDETSKIVFNYLIPTPTQDSSSSTKANSPLRPNTTYCVSVKKMVNKKGEEIAATTSSFTTESDASMVFDTKVDGEFFFSEVAPSQLNADGKIERQDYILLYFPTNHVDPDKLRKRIKLCIERPTIDPSQGNCGKFRGVVIPSEVYLIEGLQNNADDKILSSYNLFAITSSKAMVEGEKYQVALNLDMGSESEESNQGYLEREFEIGNPEYLSWEKAYRNDILDESNQSIAVPTHQIFYIGSGSNTTYDWDKSLAENNSSL